MGATTLAYQVGRFCLFTPGSNDIWAVMPNGHLLKHAQHPIGFILEDFEEFPAILSNLTPKNRDELINSGSGPNLIIADRVVSNIHPLKFYVLAKKLTGNLTLEPGVVAEQVPRDVIGVVIY